MTELEILLVILIITAVLLLAGCLGWICIRKHRENHSVRQGGMDIDTQKSGADSGRMFRGTTEQSGGTYILQGSRKAMYHICLQEVTRGENYTARFRDSIGIGRAQNIKGMENFLTIKNDMRVSNFQCRLIAANGMNYIEDAGSRNHTEVNGQRITRPCALKNNDLIRIGNTRLRVKF